MSNSVTGTNRRIVGSFDTQAASTLTITASPGQLVDVSVDFDTSTAFVGTIALERKTSTGASNIGEWQTVEEYTASAEKVAQSATAREYRLNATTVTSGQAEFELSAGAVI